MDDGSTDSSPSILEYYSRLDPRIKVIPNIYRPGAVGARNTAISVSTGKYISFLDSDDLWGTHVLKTQLEAFSSGEVLLHSNINVIDRHSKFLHMITYPRRFSFHIFSSLISCLIFLFPFPWNVWEACHP